MKNTPRLGMPIVLQALDTGICGCQGYDLKQGGDYLFLMEKMQFLEFYARDLDEDTTRELVNAICSGVIAYGEHGQVSDGNPIWCFFFRLPNALEEGSNLVYFVVVFQMPQES